MMKTECDNCCQWLTLTIWDDDTLIGGECECGYYVTRYTDEFAYSADWL